MESLEKPVDIKKEFVAERKRLWIITAESISVFIITYLIISFFNNSIPYLVAKKFNLVGELHYYGIRWITLTKSPLWHARTIIITFLSGPIFSLFIACFLYMALIISKRWHYLFRLFFTWSFFHSIVYFLGAYIAGVLSRKGFWYASGWLGSKLIHEIIIAISFAVLAGFLGRYILKMFLSSASSSSFIRSKNQKKYIIHQSILPWSIGSVILCIIKLPGITIYEALILCSYILFFISMIFSESYTIFKPGKIKIYQNFYISKFNLKLPLIAFVLLIAYRLLLR